MNAGTVKSIVWALVVSIGHVPVPCLHQSTATPQAACGLEVQAVCLGLPMAFGQAGWRDGAAQRVLPYDEPGESNAEALTDALRPVEQKESPARFVQGATLGHASLRRAQGDAGRCRAPNAGIPLYTLHGDRLL